MIENIEVQRGDEVVSARDLLEELQQAKNEAADYKARWEMAEQEINRLMQEKQG